MENEEKILRKLWQDPEFKPALLVGGLIFYVPIINFLLLGYGAVFIKRLKQKQGLEVISWREINEIFRETVKILPLILVYVILPLLVAGGVVYLLQVILAGIHLDFFAYTLAYLPMCFVGVLIPGMFILALRRYYRYGNFQRALEVASLFKVMISKKSTWIEPILLFSGWLTLTWPLAGFGFFAGLLPFLATVTVRLELAKGK